MNFIGMKILVTCCALVCAAVQADCTLDLTGEADRGPPVTFNLPAQVLSISADMPVDTAMPFATIVSPTAGHAVTYINCTPGVPYGGMPFGLPPPDGNNMYATNIHGVGMKIRWDNGSVKKDIPYSSLLPMELSRIVYPARSYFLIELFKTADVISLVPNKSNVVLDGGDVAYNFVGVNSMSNFAQKLNVGRITINSTPACTFENAKSIDFNTVTPTMSDAGVERPLDFTMNCRTDYGRYSVLASIIADSRTNDGKYISVTDAGGNTDRLRIEITDHEGVNVTVDGNSLRKVTSNDKLPAQFKWKATLTSLGPTSKRPTGGRFDARAEILLQVN
ncbi:fimbrial protein [Erwinia sp. AnSW2-5]|uniref:fimbrial protein n=1 Tax=Erwinia sp. AnSW2-5 TaxID=3367692 RepID=UPI00385DCFB2